MQQNEWGLVLSGGGIRGAAHAGVIRALEEHGIEPEVVAGASAGAIAGSLYAGGYSWSETLDLFDNPILFKWSLIGHWRICKPYPLAKTQRAGAAIRTGRCRTGLLPEHSAGRGKQTETLRHHHLARTAR